MIHQAVGQICSTSSLTANLSQCRTVIQKAVKAGAKALFLPEASDYISHGPEESLSLCQPVSTSPFVLGLQAEARKHRLPIHVGIHEPSETKHKHIKNTLIWIDENGNITNRYQKLHLFDLDLSDSGGPKMKESDSIEPGNEMPAPFDTALGKVGSLICFDLRFPEVALALKRQKADIITYPSAFTPSTGKAHWHVLLRSRAIETQTYVIASAQCGAHNDKRTSYGHTIVIDPWGTVLAELGGWEEHKELGDKWEPEIVTVDINLDLVNKIRREMPLLRRT